MRSGGRGVTGAEERAQPLRELGLNVRSRQRLPTGAPGTGTARQGAPGAAEPDSRLRARGNFTAATQGLFSRLSPFSFLTRSCVISPAELRGEAELHSRGLLLGHSNSVWMGCQYLKPSNKK